MRNVEAAASAIRDGELVVYPTETVYGLGADALEPTAIDRVFLAKDRDRDEPISLAVPDVETALEYVTVSDRERRFMDRFMPGPVTVVCERREPVPDALTAGLDRVGVRIPDHDLARGLLDQIAPITATSANVTGQPSVTRAKDVGPEIREAAAVVLDGGETGGTGSTVVDVERGAIHRRGAIADEVEAWIESA